MAYKDLLRQWKLEGYVEKFEEEEIDDETFGCLAPEMLKTLFPKVGPYSRFLKEYNLWKQSQGKTETDARQTENIPIGVFQIDSSGSLTKLNEEEIVVSEDLTQEDDLTNKEVVNASETAVDAFPIKENVPIFATLHENMNGRLAIYEYKKKGRLSSQSQQYVAEALLIHELRGNIDKKITRDRFIELAQYIQELFPSEQEKTYYRPYFKDILGNKHGAGGKLVDLLYNTRKKYIKSGVREKKRPTNKSDDLNESEYTPSGDVLNKINALAVSCTPWQDTVSKWEDTHEYRMKEVREDAREITTKRKKGSGSSSVTTTSSNITLYLQRYRGLQENLGYTLLELDYSLLYPGTENRLEYLWPDFKKKICSVLQARAKKGAPPACTEGDSDAKILCSMSLLVKPKNLKDNSNSAAQTWKPTREIIQEGFLVHVVKSADVSSKVKALQKCALERKERAQPFAIVVGDDLNTITESWTTVEGVSYKVDSPVKAIDSTFKIFQAIHAEYPKHAEPLWLLLQICVYGVRTPWDNRKEVESLSALIQDLSCHI